MGTVPEVHTLLCEDRLVDECIKVYILLKEMGAVPEVATCNYVLPGCLKERELDRFWELCHQGMAESEFDIVRIMFDSSSL